MATPADASRDPHPHSTSREAPRADTGTDEHNADTPADTPAKVCPGQTADYPTPYFDDTLLIRLPKGVSDENFVEVAPQLVKLSGEVESVSCTQGLPGGVILSMELIARPDAPDEPLVALRDPIFEALALSGYRIAEETIDPEDRLYQAVLDGRQGDPEETPTRVFVQLKAAYGTLYAITFEARPEAWSALEETFRRSASTLITLPK